MAMAASTGSSGEKKNGELFFSNNSGFALLYNGEGLKYTIGREFESRERQGEYLVCYRDGVADTSHCEITIAGGQFWVEDVQGRDGKGTFINGKRIYGKRKTELKFGDVLSLGGPGEQAPGPGCTDLLFKEMGLTARPWARYVDIDSDSDDFESDSDSEKKDEGVLSEKETQNDNENENVFEEPTPLPLRNTLVLAKLFSYLRTSDLKTCRLVSSEWNGEATELFKSKATTKFEYGGLWYRDIFNFPTMFPFVQEMGGFFPQGQFHVMLPHCTIGCKCSGCRDGYTASEINGDNIRINMEAKLLSDLEWFFDGGFPGPITRLKLCGTMRGSEGKNMIFAVLKGATSLHLEDLDLQINVDMRRDSYSHPVAPFPMNFPSLKRLTVCFTTNKSNCSDVSSSHMQTLWMMHSRSTLYPVPADKMKNWITSMITAAPALESLKIANNDLESLLRTLGQVFLKAIIKEKGFPNLNSLDLFSYNYWVLNTILDLPKLKRLTLGAIRPDFEHNEGRCALHNDERGPEFPPWTSLMGWVLEQSADTLEYLDLTLPRLSPRTERYSISFPVFSKLEVFKLCGFYANCIALADSGLRFELDFPVLKDLCVRVNLHKGWDGPGVQENDFFKIFFDENDDIEIEDDEDNDDTLDDDGDGDPEADRKRLLQTCGQSESIKKCEEKRVITSLKFLEIQKLEVWSPAGVKKMDKLFPHAFNHHLEKIRKADRTTEVELEKMESCIGSSS